MPGTFIRKTANPSNPSEHEINPQYVPSVAADLITEDFHVTEVVLSNVTASAVTVTIADKQATPLSLFGAVSVPANSVLVAAFRGRLMLGGINWVASSASAIVGAVRGY